ncbi:hypothetical protein BASA81_000474 [Batrachochytrium salamandrivorans]|nr:hypothetical protein BASA81_000474 [Batrachochytrium salamandrivorans]
MDAPRKRLRRCNAAPAEETMAYSSCLSLEQLLGEAKPEAQSVTESPQELFLASLPKLDVECAQTAGALPPSMESPLFAQDISYQRLVPPPSSPVEPSSKAMNLLLEENDVLLTRFKTFAM